LYEKSKHGDVRLASVLLPHSHEGDEGGAMVDLSRRGV
jgi:hypothetical protein